MNKAAFLLVFPLTIVSGALMSQNPSFTPPVSFEAASAKADSIVRQLTLDEKLGLIGGHNSFFIKGLERFGFPNLYMADATAGVHIRDSFRNRDLGAPAMEKSTAFPCPLLLAATWNADLCSRFAEAVGEECRAGGVAVLLGPGLNLYRVSQCGRNFEYFGEDPFLAGRMIAHYVTGLQSTGTVATLKHFLANNTDFYRRRSNSVVDERTIRELYARAFQEGIEAGAMAVMTSYNLLNGEWTGQSESVIHDLLRNQLGFKWLVMTDWWSVWDGEKVIQSGQDLEMPGAEALKKTKELLAQGRIRESDIDRMARSILTTVFAMGLYDRPAQDKSYDGRFPAHVETALQTGREGIVLLKNGGVLPIRPGSVKRILVTGKYVTEIAAGGGAAAVQGYDPVTLLDALKKEYGDKVVYDPYPSEASLKEADAVLVNTGTDDSEGWDRPFDLPSHENAFILKCLAANPRSVVIVHSGSGVNMSPWNGPADAVVYSWYKGQIGNIALAEILSGRTNPSGRLPISIEKRFEDSPGYGYMPEGDTLYTGWAGNREYEHPVYDVEYKEGVFIGYRWYEHQKIEPLYAFGHGLSYTTFLFSDLEVAEKTLKPGETVHVSLRVRNTGSVEGAETVQVYIRDEDCSVPRPEKELKEFAKVFLKPGEERIVSFELGRDAFAFWDASRGDWTVEPGAFRILIGRSSKDIVLEKSVEAVM
jgi:beta-glucosidase